LLGENLSLGQKLSSGQNFLQQSILLVIDNLLKITTIYFDMFLQVYLQFCNTNGFVATSDVIMLFNLLLDGRFISFWDAHEFD